MDATQFLPHDKLSENQATVSNIFSLSRSTREFLTICLQFLESVLSCVVHKHVIVKFSLSYVVHFLSFASALFFSESPVVAQRDQTCVSFTPRVFLIIQVKIEFCVIFCCIKAML